MDCGGNSDSTKQQTGQQKAAVQVLALSLFIEWPLNLVISSVQKK